MDSNEPSKETLPKKSVPTVDELMRLIQEGRVVNPKLEEEKAAKLAAEKAHQEYREANSIKSYVLDHQSTIEDVVICGTGITTITLIIIVTVRILRILKSFNDVLQAKAAYYRKASAVHQQSTNNSL